MPKTIRDTGLAHTFRCAFPGVSRTFADLKVCASRFFHTFSRRGLRSCAPSAAVARSRSRRGTFLTNFRFTPLALFALSISLASCNKSQKRAATEEAQRTFASPADAGKALIEATKAGDRNALLAIFGPGSNDLIFSGDETQNKVSFEHFTSAFETMNRCRK